MQSKRAMAVLTYSLHLLKEDLEHGLIIFERDAPL
jgi:hypothetical protein